MSRTHSTRSFSLTILWRCRCHAEVSPLSGRRQRMTQLELQITDDPITLGRTSAIGPCCLGRGKQVVDVT